MGKEQTRQGNAERLLALHDELDRLDRKESYTGLSLLLVLAAVVLMAVGMSQGGVYLEVNGLLLGFVGLIIGAKEISKRRRMRSLDRKIGRLEGALEGALVDGRMADPEIGAGGRIP